MRLNTRQARIFTLAYLLRSGKPVKALDIIQCLDCSEPTLTRALRELRDFYSAGIKYSKANHTYQLVTPGLLNKKTLIGMNDALLFNTELKSCKVNGKVVLDKDKKTAVSLSLRIRVLRKIDRFAELASVSRSEAVEKLAEKVVDTLIKELSQKQLGQN